MRAWIRRNHPLWVVLVSGAFVAIAAFGGTTTRAADAQPDFDTNDGSGGAVHLSPYTTRSTESHFDWFTGLPQGWSYTEDPHGFGATTVYGAVPSDMVGRRAIPLPVGFAIGVLLGFVLVIGARRGASPPKGALLPARR